MMKVLIPQAKVKHLTSRASFGWGIDTAPADMKRLRDTSEKILPLQAVERPVINKTVLSATKQDSSKRELVKSLLSKSRQDLMKVNVAWITKLTKEPSLRERMTFFWHGHFACRTPIPYFAQQQNNTIRTFALDSFNELLMAVSKDPAMLQFLNNQQNRKDHPNENFAREVMELFTLGRGNYSEADVKEAARAFTGWGFNLQGEFQFRPRQHDFDEKNFKGIRKNYTGEEILQAILQDKQTARFITVKLYRSFVSQQSPIPSVVDAWAEDFYRSGYNIRKLITEILESGEFNRPENAGNRIKSPVELLVSLQMHTGGTFESAQSLVFLQRAMGQLLFYPPNVSGWPVGEAWIDSSSLTFRVSLPNLLFGGEETDFEARDDGDANGIGVELQGRKRLHCNVNWSQMANQFMKGSSKETLASVEDFLLSRPTSSVNRDLIARVSGTAKEDKEFIKKAFIGYMSLPDYQLC